jgi:hypothetical protein
MQIRQIRTFRNFLNAEDSNCQRLIKKNMDWNTLYITGRADFRELVRRKLESSRLPHMPGYLDASLGRGTYDLYWLDDAVPLRDFKEAIGAKLIWKDRLRFYPNLEEFIDAVNGGTPSLEFTDEEQDLLDNLRKSA